MGEMEIMEIIMEMTNAMTKMETAMEIIMEEEEKEIETEIKEETEMTNALTIMEILYHNKEIMETGTSKSLMRMEIPLYKNWKKWLIHKEETVMPTPVAIKVAINLEEIRKEIILALVDQEMQENKKLSKFQIK